MNTHDIELRSAIMGAITEVWDRAKQIDDAADEVLDLIEADRQRRGVPVAYIRTISFENGEVQRDLMLASAAGDLSRYMDFVSFEPLYLAAPQPAAPKHGEEE